MSNLKHVFCFDLFGTLIAAPAGTPSYEELFVEAGCWREHVQAYVRRHFTAGPAPRMSYLEMAKALCCATPTSRDLDPEQVARVWEAENRSMEWLPRMKEVVERRLSDYCYLLVTNITNAALAEPFIQEVISKFDGAYLSCRELCSKPDPYVWQNIMHHYPAERYFMYGDSQVSDLAVPSSMGWIVSDPRNWLDPDDVCHQEFRDEGGLLREVVK